MRPARHRLRVALALLAVGALVCWAAGASCFGRVAGGATEGAAWDVPPGECTVAIAYRDDVPDDQKAVTKLFTVPFLAAAYDDARYFVAARGDSRHGEVTDALARARAAGCRVDVFILVNGGDYASWLRSLRPEQRPALGLVYDTGGGDAVHAPTWMSFGARVFVGHPGVNIAPAFYTFLLPQLSAGATVDDAVARANAATLQVLRATRALGLADDDDVRALWAGTEAIRVGDGAVTIER